MMRYVRVGGFLWEIKSQYRASVDSVYCFEKREVKKMKLLPPRGSFVIVIF